MSNGQRSVGFVSTFFIWVSAFLGGSLVAHSSLVRLLQRLHKLQYFLRVAFDVNFREDLGDLAILVDDPRGSSFDAQSGLELLVCVGQERESELFLVRKLLLRFNVVRTEADHDR